MKIIALARHELKVMWKGLRLSLRRKSWLFVYFLLGIVAAGLSTILHMFFFVISPELRHSIINLLGESSELITPYNLLLIGATLWLAYRIQSGLLSERLARQYTRSDVAVLFTSPIPPADVSMGKHLANGVRRSVILVIVFLTLSPLIRYLDMGLGSSTLAFAVILMFVEFSYFVEEIVFSLRHSVRLHGLWKSLRFWMVVVVLVILAVWTVFDPPSANFLLQMSPPHSLSRVLQRCHVSAISCSTVVWTPSLSYFGALVIGSALMSHLLIGARYGWIVERVESPPRISLLRMGGPRTLALSNRGRPVLSLFLKELWTAIRERGWTIASELVLGYVLLAFAILARPIILELLFENPALADGLTPAVFAVTSLMTILASPAPDSLGKERGELWIYHATPLPFRNVIGAKFLYATAYTLTLILPVVVATVLILPTFSSQVWLLAVWAHVLCFSNAIGMLVGSRLLASFKERGLASLPAQLFYVVLSLTASVPLLIFLLSLMEAWNSLNQVLILFAMLTLYSTIVVNVVLRVATKESHEI